MVFTRPVPAGGTLAILLLLLLAVSVQAQGARVARRARSAQRSTPGALQVGDTAPLFKLKSLDGSSETDLVSFREKKPVVLLFGSYT